jgi:ribonuclease P protein component
MRAIVPEIAPLKINISEQLSRGNLPDSAFPMSFHSKPAERQSIVGVRLRRHSDYQRAYAAARKRQSASMSWFLAPQTIVQGSQPSKSRIGLTAGKVLGKAHDRNRIKRRMREALRRHVDLLPAGCDLIFHPRRAVLTMEFTKLEAEIVRILEQAHAEAARTASPAAETRRISAEAAS